MQIMNMYLQVFTYSFHDTLPLKDGKLIVIVVNTCIVVEILNLKSRISYIIPILKDQS